MHIRSGWHVEGGLMARSAGLTTLIILVLGCFQSVEATEPRKLGLAFEQSALADDSADAGILPLFSHQPSEATVDWSSLKTSDQPSTLMQVSMTPESTSGTWVLVAPYVWATAQHGTIGAAGRTAPVDLSLADLVELIPDLNGAAMGHVEVGKGKFGLIFDAMLMKVEPSENLPGGGEIDIESSSTILESLAMLRVVDVPDEDAGSFVTVDLLSGLRYYQVQNAFRLDPVVGPTIAADISKDWVDLLVGARTAVAITSELSGFLRADFAGFGIGTSSDLTWNLTTGAEYACPSLPGSSLVLGYRILSIDETQGQGTDRFIYDVTLQGPFTAIAFRF
jgi:hypothetical protein